MIPASGCWQNPEDSLLEVIGAGAGSIQMAQRRHGLAAHRLLDQRRLTHLYGPERFA